MLQFKNIAKKLISSILTLIFLVLFIVSAFNIVKWHIANRQNNEIKEELSEIVVFDEKDNKYNINFDEIKKINEDTVGWLKINGTEIEYIVVRGKDNNYYLNHNFKKEYNQAGWIFADFKNTFDGSDKNIVIYGHNMRDGSMFGTLKKVLNKDWYNNDKNYIIDLVTESEEQEYQVFSIYQIEKEDFYITTDFKDDEFSNFINKIKQRSIKDFNVEITKEDSILTVSTCANDNRYRVVLHAKKVTR